MPHFRVGQRQQTDFFELVVDPVLLGHVGLLLGPTDLGARDDLVPGLFFHVANTPIRIRGADVQRGGPRLKEHSAPRTDPPGHGLN